MLLVAQRNGRSAREVTRPTTILVVDVGGSRVKVSVTRNPETRKVTSGRRMTPDKMVRAVRDLVPGWNYDAVSLVFWN